MYKAFIISLLLFIALTAKEQWVEATGASVIDHQDLVHARRAAIRDALRQVSFQGALQVSGYQAMSKGELHTDQLSINTQGSISQMEVLKEEVKNGMMFITVKALIESSGKCEGGNYANGYKRSLAISNFYMERPQSANMGALHNANETLPKEILQRMQGQERLRVFDAAGFQLYNDVSTIPTSVMIVQL